MKEHSFEREVWTASVLLEDMSVDLFAFRMTGAWEKIGGGRLLLPAENDTPQFDRAWLMFPVGRGFDGADRLRAIQRTLSTVTIHLYGEEDIVRSLHDWLGNSLGGRGQVDRTIQVAIEVIDKNAKKSERSAEDWNEIQDAVMRLPDWLTFNHKGLAAHLGVKPGTVRNNLRAK